MNPPVASRFALALPVVLLVLLAGIARADEAEQLQRRIERQRARIAEIEALLRERGDQEEARTLLEGIKANLEALEASRNAAAKPVDRSEDATDPAPPSAEADRPADAGAEAGAIRQRFERQRARIAEMEAVLAERGDAEELRVLLARLKAQLDSNAGRVEEFAEAQRWLELQRAAVDRLDREREDNLRQVAEAVASTERTKARLAEFEARWRAAAAELEGPEDPDDKTDAEGAADGEAAREAARRRAMAAWQAEIEAARGEAAARAKAAELAARDAALDARRAEMEARMGTSMEELQDAIRARAAARRADAEAAAAAARGEAEEVERRQAEVEALRRRAAVLEQAARAQVARIEAEGAELRRQLASTLAEGTDEEGVADLKRRLERLSSLAAAARASLLAIEKARLLLETGRRADAVQAARRLKEAVVNLEGGRPGAGAAAPPAARERPGERRARAEAPEGRGPLARVRHLRAAAEHLEAAGEVGLARQVRAQAEALEGQARTQHQLEAVLDEVRALRREVRALREAVAR